MIRIAKDTRDRWCVTEVCTQPGRLSLLMRQAFLVCSILVSIQATDAAEPDEALLAWGKRFELKVKSILEEKCISCHSKENNEGEFDLSAYVDSQSAIDGGDVWDRVARRVRQNEMPPEGSPGLNDREKGTLHGWVDSRPNQDLCHQLASDETQSWYRGHVMSRRLTRTEYTNAIRDLVGYRIAESDLPPSDGAGGEGFDTVGDALFTSTIHLEKYLRIADQAIQDVAFKAKERLNAPLPLHQDLNTTTDLPDLGDNASTAFPPPSNEPNQRIVARFAELLSAGFGKTQQELDVAARELLENFARQAWRRPLLAEELDRLFSLYQRECDEGVHPTDAVLSPMKAILVSPHFLFVVEKQPEKPGVQRLSPYELAMRLSLFVWSSIPDEALLAQAGSEALYNDDVIVSELKRMLKDSRASALGNNFGLQWLGLTDFAGAIPDADVYPEFNRQLAEDLLREPTEFITHVFRNERPLTDFIQSDYVYLNGRLAAYYGVDLSDDANWQKVSLNDGRRGGVITMGSVLVRTSYPRRTSPVIRGRWILEEILGAKVPPPPPNVPALDASHASTENLTLRQRLELHREKAECASCHNRMDPLGFGLENFDAIGRWRDSENGQSIDAVGSLPSGDVFTGPEELKRVILNRSDEFRHHFTRKMLGFALGRELNKFDACIVDRCVEALRTHGDRSTIVLEQIVLAYPFQYRYSKAE